MLYRWCVNVAGAVSPLSDKIKVLDATHDANLTLYKSLFTN